MGYRAEVTWNAPRVEHEADRPQSVRKVAAVAGSSQFDRTEQLSDEQAFAWFAGHLGAPVMRQSAT